MQEQDNYRSKARIFGVLTVILALLHHDFWYWDDRTLVMGFMPIGLFYHLLFSIAAAALWAMTIKFAWPSHIEEWADEVQDSGDGEGGGQ